MTIVSIPLQAVPNQLVRVSLNGQQVVLNLISTASGMMMSINSNGIDLMNSVSVINNEPLIPSTYLGFIGDLIFYDTQGDSNPSYDGLNSRYLLLYMDGVDYAKFLQNR